MLFRSIGQLLVGLLSPTDGAIYYHGEKIGGKSLTRGEKKARKQAGTNLQMIFQDSYSSLNPRKHIYDILAQPSPANAQRSANLHPGIWS